MGTDDGCVQLEAMHVDRQVWLLKLPTMVANAWVAKDKTGMPSDPSVAKVVCTFDPLDSAQQMEFTMELLGPDCADIPKCYSLNLQKDVAPMEIFGETQGKLGFEGKVERKFDLKPNSKAREEYRQLCRERDRKSNLKTRTIQFLNDDRGSFMRPALAPTFMPFKDNKKRPAPASKGNEGKRTRRDRGELEDLIFQLFERQANWALKNLVTETDQPVAFLKEILNDLCTYNKRGTNQGTYELKPEYKKSSVAEDEKPAAA